MSESPPGSAWAPLRRPLFRALWIATVASHIGSYMTDVGQGWLMATLAPSPLMVALMLSAESLPFFLLALTAGALADVVDRRRLLLVTQGMMVAVIGTLCGVALAGAVTPWLLLGLAFAFGVATALNDPAWHAIAPELLPAEEIAAGVTLNGVAINIARTIGPAVGGFVVALWGPSVVFLLDAVSFLGVMAVLFAWRRERVQSVLPAERVLGAVRAGLRYARHSVPLRRVLARIFAFMACGAGVMALMPVLARETGRGAVALGFLLGSVGTGAILGAALLPRLQARLSTDGVIAAGTLVFAAVAAALGRARTVEVLCPILVVGGVAWISVLATLNVAAQRVSPAWVRARALAVFLLTFQAGIAVGSALWGAVAARWGLGAAYAGIAAGLSLGALVLARVRIAPVEIMDHSPSHHWPDPETGGEPRLEDGPVLIEVEYHVDPARADDFARAMQELGRTRRRDGAIQWWIFQDTADRAKFVETWIVETWAEHLRQHERVSVADRALEDRVRACFQPGERERVRHFVSAYPRTNIAPRLT